ncbi:MAG: DUF3575 domain-containing protein [bacterium]|nr:DUF3575 domain-containing protein [bacterium]
MQWKKSWVLLTLILTLVSPAWANKPVHRKAISTNLYGATFGLYTLRYEHQLSIKQSVNVSVTSWDWENGDKSGNGVGYGIGYRYYFYRPLQGYFYGLGIHVIGMSATNNNDTPQEVSEYNSIFYPHFEGGYAFFLPKNIQLTVGLNSYFGIGQLRDTDYPYFGLQVIPNISVGYRF